MINISPHHIAATCEEIASAQPGGRFFFLPGSSGRARRIAERFTERRLLASDRGHDLHLGTLSVAGQSIDVGAVATGMGCPSLEIIVTELIALGAKRFLRVGTAGSLQPEFVEVTHVVIATGAVRDEGTSCSYAPLALPAIASPPLVQAACRAAEKTLPHGVTHTGLIHTKASLFAREFFVGPREPENRRYLQQLKDLGVLASEMEAAQLFILNQVYQAKARAQAPHREPDFLAGCILAVIGDCKDFAPEDQRQVAEERAIDLAIATAAELGTGSPL